MGSWIEEAGCISTGHQRVRRFTPFVLNLHRGCAIERSPGIFLRKTHLIQVASFISEMIPRLFHKY